MKRLVFLVAILFLVSTVSGALNYGPVFNGTYDRAIYNQTTTMDPGTSTPWEVWWASGLIGLGMFLLSLRPRTSAMELEVDAIISAVSLVPIAFCAWSSASVDRVVGYGVGTNIDQMLGTGVYASMVQHTIYSFPVIQILMAAFFLVSIGNLLRIIAQHRIFQIKTQEEQLKQNI